MKAVSEHLVHGVFALPRLCVNPPYFDAIFSRATLPTGGGLAIVGRMAD